MSYRGRSHKPPVFPVSWVAYDPPPAPLPSSILFLQKGRLTSAVAVFGADSSRAPGSPAPVGCCRYYRSAQPAPTHPGSASPCFPAQGSPGLPVTQYSSVRSCCYPPPTRAKCLPPGAGAATASAACVQAVLLSAGFLRVLVTHCLLCEKRGVDLFQVREQRFSQPLWPSSSCSFVRSLEPRPQAVLQVQLNCKAGGSSVVNP